VPSVPGSGFAAGAKGLTVPLLRLPTKKLDRGGSGAVTGVDCVIHVVESGVFICLVPDHQYDSG